MKKTLVAAALLAMFPATLPAEESGKTPHPEAVLMEGVKKLERDYINGMRPLASEATSLVIFRIKSTPTPADPSAGSPPKAGEEPPFNFTANGAQAFYPVLSKRSVKDAETIKAWAGAILPAESFPLTRCVPHPGFAVRFLDADGGIIHQTTVCLTCGTTDFQVLRPAGRLGVDAALIRRLLADQGFDLPANGAE